MTRGRWVLGDLVVPAVWIACCANVLDDAGPHAQLSLACLVDRAASTRRQDGHTAETIRGGGAPSIVMVQMFTKTMRSEGAADG